MEAAAVGLIALITATLGSLGGLGGAVLMVPALVLLGWSPIEAAPPGMAMVAASSFAAASANSRALLVNHRLGVSLEVVASAGAAIGALVSVRVGASGMMVVLGAASIAAGVLSGARRGQRNLPDPDARFEELHDRTGELDSAYIDARGVVVPYRVRRLPLGLAITSAAGVVAGLTGTSGGYIKTPVMSELLHVPVKVAASTTVFMVGVTSSVALAVYASQGRVGVAIGPAVVGGLLGGRTGASLQRRLPAAMVRRVLAIALIVIGGLLLVRS